MSSAGVDAAAARPDKLGVLGKQHYETVLWRLADAQVQPLYSPTNLPTGGSGSTLWGATPEQTALLDPGAGGRLPPERAHRKRLQIEALVGLVQALLPPPLTPSATSTSTTSAAAAAAAAAHATAPTPTTAPSPSPPTFPAAPTTTTPTPTPCTHLHVVDFCGGSGHTALVIAAAVPTATVTIVDFNSTALRLATERAAKLGLTNLVTHCGDVATFSAPFSVGLALHACGAATDMALARCRESRAAFVVSPCCVGKIGKKGGNRPREPPPLVGSAAELPLPRSGLFGAMMSSHDYLALAAAADFHSVEHPVSSSAPPRWCFADVSRGLVSLEVWGGGG
jgi:hypothetical protein